MIRPTLEYCAGVWGCCGEVNSGILETLQRRVGRIVIKTPSGDTEMKALKWPRLRSRRDEHFLKLVRKCVHGLCPQYFKNYFVYNKDICARSTHQSSLLHLPARRTYYLVHISLLLLLLLLLLLSLLLLLLLLSIV